jgi:protein gp37
MPTGVEWVINPDGTPGLALNPTFGCRKKNSECRNCYAEALAAQLVQRFGKNPNSAIERYKMVLTAEGRWNGEIYFYPDVLEKAEKRQKKTTYFVGNMSDILAKNVRSWRERMWQTFYDCRDKHTFLLLTKHPDRMWEWLLEMGEVLPNVWIGTTIGSEESAIEHLPYIRKITEMGHSTYISGEPLISSVVFEFATNSARWVILGGESEPSSKSYVRPTMLEWMEHSVYEALDSKVDVFVKQLGKYALSARGYGDRTRLLTEQEVAILTPRANWVHPKLNRYLTSDKKGGGDTTDEFPEWARVRTVPYLAQIG